MTREQPKVDPRFDPIFQRGYEGGAPGAGTPAAASIPASPQITASPADPAPPSEPAQPAQVQPKAPSGVAPSDPIVTTEYVGAEQSRRSLNPFIVLLWVIGPALAGTGASASYQSLSRVWGDGSRGDDLAVQQLIWTMGPVAVTIGLGIVAGLLFWHAAAWRRSRN